MLPGRFLVAFWPGVITGLHDRSEVVLDDLCRQLGGFDCRIFDPYFFYSECADRGWLRRVEYIDQRGQVGVHFYYPEGGDIEEIRQRLIKSILQMAAQEPKLWRHGRAVIWEDDRPRLVVRNPEYVKKGEKNLPERILIRALGKGNEHSE